MKLFSQHFKLEILTLFILQTLWIPISSYGAVYPAPLCQVLMQYSGKETRTWRDAQTAKSISLIRQFLSQFEGLLPQKAVAPAPEVFWSNGLEPGRILLANSQTPPYKGFLPQDLLKRVMRTLSENSPHQLASAWSTNDPEEIVSFHETIQSTPEKLKDPHEKYLKFLSRMKKRLAFCSALGLTLTFSPMIPFYCTEGLPVSIQDSLLMGTIGGFFASLLLFLYGGIRAIPPRFLGGFEVEKFPLIRPAIENFSESLQSDDPKDWALLHLERSSLNFNALTFIDERDQTRKLVVMMWGERPENEILEKMQASFESWE